MNYIIHLSNEAEGYLFQMCHSPSTKEVYAEEEFLAELVEANLRILFHPSAEKFAPICGRQLPLVFD